VSRLRAVTILDEPAIRPADFDLAAFWTQSSAEFRAALPVHRVVVRVSPDALSRARLGWRFATIETEGEPEADGWVTCTIRADSEEIAADAVLSLGGGVEILHPPEIAARARELARGLLAGTSGAARRD
jgi:predicted DNA-binding transcriptional regulator YafY